MGLLLMIWMTLALLWWIIAISLLVSKISLSTGGTIPRLRESPEYHPVKDSPADAGSSLQFSERTLITIFKPTTPAPTQENLQQCFKCLETFFCQMNSRHELLLGILPSDFSRWQPHLKQWEQAFPQAKITVIQDPPHETYSNPKIAWQKTLAPYAHGDLWLWSDLDITAPPGYLESMEKEFHASRSPYLTNAYLISQSGNSWGDLDTLFVNMEFLPGVLFLKKTGRLKTAFGAGILFSSKDLTEKNHWDLLGHSIADDFQLAQILKSGELSATLVQTEPHKNTFEKALLHYARWHKTIRWCDPLGYRGQILILPLLGALALTLLGKTSIDTMAFISLGESAIGAIGLGVCCQNFSIKSLPQLLLWPWIRAGVWLWTWFPFSVKWGKTSWKKPILP